MPIGSCIGKGLCLRLQLVSFAFNLISRDGSVNSTMARMGLLLLLLAAAHGEEKLNKLFGTGLGAVYIGGTETDSEVGKDGPYTPSKLVYACN